MYAELAVAAASAVVGAVTTESWTWAKERIRALHRDGDGGGGGNITETDDLLSQVEVIGQDADTAALEPLRLQWAGRLEALLTEHPELVPDVRALVEEAAKRGVPSIGPVTPVQQTVTGHDNAQQAVQGHGVQNVSFGSAPDH